MPMGFDAYFASQERNLVQIRYLECFTKLMDPLDALYEHSVTLIPPTSHPVLGRLFIACHKSFLSAAALIARAQPDDCGGITRRAIEAACLGAAIKHDASNLDRWRAYEERLARWQARERNDVPKPLKQRVKYPSDPIVSILRAQLGAISDESVHFTPEFLSTQDWRLEDHGGPRIQQILQYFERSQPTLERALVGLAAVHVHIVTLFDELFESVFQQDATWADRCETLKADGDRLANQVLRDGGDAVPPPSEETR